MCQSCVSLHPEIFFNGKVRVVRKLRVLFEISASIINVTVWKEVFLEKRMKGRTKVAVDTGIVKRMVIIVTKLK